MNRYTSADARLRQAGFMAVHKQDFNAHYRGEDFQHGAPDILMEPPLPAFPTAPTVQDTLNMMYHLISTQGSGFISIGNTDGYELGDYNAGSLACPTVYDAFNAAFTDSRLDNGGIILVLEGTYHLTQTVTIPAGICVMGGISGTTIIGETSETPMFIISRGDEDLSIGGDSGGGAISHDMGSPLDQVKFFNIILADNLEGVVKSGGVIISTMTTCPMIKCNSGSDFECENVRFIGRVDDGPEAARTKTLRAIGYQSPAGYASHLKVKHCFFDGVRTAIDFDSQEGVSDFLVVEGCRARTFGTEDIASLAAVDNCFVSFSLCNANFANNYHVGFDGTWRTVGTCFAVASTNGTLTDIKVVITGNTGGPNLVSPLPSILRDDTGTLTTIRAIKSGNSWGQNIQNDWFVTVGSSTPTVNEPSGDFIGINSLDTIFEANKSNPFTIILNPGTYNLSSVRGGRFKLIGNKINGLYPTVVLNGGTWHNGAGIAYSSVGPECKSIKFMTNDGTARSIIFNNPETSEMFGTNGKTVLINDCIFYDCGCGIESGTVSASNRAIFHVLNCFFYSSGTSQNYAALIMGNPENAIIENCNFSIIGQAILTGVMGGAGITLSQSITIKDCSIYCRGLTSIQATASTVANFIYIQTKTCTIENCQIFCSTTYAQTTPIGAGILDEVMDFIAIYAYYNISINNCSFNGPDQIYSFMGVVLPIRTLALYMAGKITIDKTNFQNGALGLYIVNNNAPKIKITNSNFVSTSGHYGCYTVAAIAQDLDLVPGINTGNVNIDNCVFGSNASSADTVVYHRATGWSNDLPCVGVLFIDTPGSNISVTNSKIYGTTTINNVANFGVNTLSALYCNNFISTKGTGVIDAQPVITKVTNNEINLINYHDISVDGDSLASLMIEGTIINVKNNNININNQNVPAGAITKAFGCLGLFPKLTTGATKILDVMISENYFSRRNLATAALTTIYNGYIFVYSTATSPRGMIVDNSFCSPTTDGADTTLLTDMTDRKFIYERNKNQTKEIEISRATGFYISSTNLVLAAVPLGGAAWQLDYVNPNPSSFRWEISLLEIIPHGTYVVSAAVSAYLTANAGATRSLTLYLQDLSPKSNNDAINPLTDVSQTALITPTNTTNANTYYIDSDGESNMTVTLAYVDANPNTIYIDAVVLQYRW